MAKELLNKKWFLFFLSLTIAVGFLLTLPPKAISAEKVVEWNFNLWGGKRGWTAPLHDWAAAMNTKTKGRWKIKLHYGGVLAPPKESYDGIKAGMFEATGICAAYTPGKNPLHTVSELPFIAPSTNEQLVQMMMEMWRHPALKKELLKWNAVPLFPAALPMYHIIGNKAVNTTEDLKGLRVRVGGEIGKVLSDFGVAVTTVPGPEIYETISRGTVDAVAFPYTYAMGSYKIHEVSKYLVFISLGTMSCFYVASKDAWDSLPEEFKEYHREWYYKAPYLWAASYKVSDDKWIPIFKKRLEYIDFPDSERNKIVAKAEGVYERWVKAREKEGLPGRDVLNYYIKKRKEITGH